MSHNLLAFGDAGVFGVDVFSFLLIDTAIKSFLLLATTLVAARLMRKRSAAAIHRLWVLSFCGCLFIPVIALVSPAWSL